MLTGPGMHIWVFSYNRGEFLQNCVDSISHCAPQCGVSIFDDDSNDPQTQKILQKLSRRFRVIRTGDVGNSQAKHGGLYANMQAAYEHMQPEDLFCFLQDDMQFVRPLSDAEMEGLQRYFSDDESRGFVHPAFFKDSSKKRNRGRVRFDEKSEVYFIDKLHHSAGACYSDVHVAKVDNLRSRDWHYPPRESLAEQQARAKFSQMAYLKSPFVAWLPNVPAYRGKRQTLALRLAQKRRQCGLYPLQYLNETENEQFIQREAMQLPYAERYLSLAVGALPQPWFYHPLQNHRLLKWMNSAEIRLHNLKSKITQQ